jgi:hypothetical protein
MKNRKCISTSINITNDNFMLRGRYFFSSAKNTIINISNIKPIAGKLSIALDTKDTYNKDDKSNSVFSARKKISTSKHKIIISDVKVLFFSF